MGRSVTWGKYRLLGRLAAGGMAEVYLAQRIDSPESFLAIKRMLPRLSDDPTFVSMFIDEAKIASGLAHPNICQIVDHGEQAHQLFMAMEFIHGKDLRVLTRRVQKRGERIPIRLVLHVLAEIAEALDYAHHKANDAGVVENIVHRDISPQNILLSYDGVAKLIDFGVAKAKDRVAQTQVGVVKGKFAYMAPEQANGGRVDARTDVFALGVVLYELCTGVLPFKGESDLSTLQRIARGEFVPPQQLNPKVPARLASIIARSLEREPGARFSRASDFAVELRCLLTDDTREMSEAVVSSYMRRLFREDYIREISRLKTYASRDKDSDPTDPELRRPEDSESLILAAGYDSVSGEGMVFGQNTRADFAGPTVELPPPANWPGFAEPTRMESMPATEPVMESPPQDHERFDVSDPDYKASLDAEHDDLGEFQTTDLDGEINELIDSVVGVQVQPMPSAPMIPTQVSQGSSQPHRSRKLLTSAEIAVLLFTAALGAALVAGIYIFS